MKPIAQSQRASLVSFVGESYRMSFTVAQLPLYNADAIINQLAAIEHPFTCNEFCCRCEIYAAVVRMRWQGEPACIDVLRLREWKMAYLLRQIFTYWHRGEFQLWNPEGNMANEPPQISQREPLNYRTYRYASMNGHFYPDGLARFCELEKIELRIVDFSQPSAQQIGIVQSAIIKAVDVIFEPDDSNDPVGPNAVEISRMDDMIGAEPIIQSQASDDDEEAEAFVETPQPKRRGKPKSHKFDTIATEIHAFMSANPSATPALVMCELRSHVGSQNTCVTANTGAGVQWEDSNGRVKTLTLAILNDRVRRWKKSHIASDSIATDE